MSFIMTTRALVLALTCAYAAALAQLTAAGDDSDCALYLSGPGRSSAYDYSLNLLKGNFAYEGQHTCITYEAVNQAYLEARNRIQVARPKGDWKPEDFASVGELVLDISINLARTYGLTYEEIEKGLPLIDTSRTLIREVCPPVFSHVDCRAGKYRRLDGLCNNLEHPTWGSTNAPFQRLIGPLFSDGINAPRIAHTGRDLPLSRVVSRTMHPDDGFHDHAGTVMVIAWGQFMDHDYTLTGTPLDPRNRNDPEECCKRPQHLKHPYCNEIRIPDDDYFYRLFGVKCIDFVRGFPSPRPGCRLGSRVPFNTLTGSLDGNTVYGVTDKFSRKLRTGYGGLLRMNPVFKDYGLKDLLPLKLDIPDEGCTRPNKNMYCFEAGEIRVNEQLVLTVMHTLMAREHNRVAQALAAINPHWDDETIFQEARRINIAEIQHITYNEFLPILLGKDVMEKFGLVLEKEGFWDGYDTTVNPDVIASFASAAYRFGHSLLPTAVERWSKAHKFIASKRLSDLIRRPYDLYRAGVLDEYVMGLMNQVAQAMDDSITQEVTNHLFKKVGARFGMDLVSFNMQRGREFGVPGYMEFRKFCGLSGADTFQDLFGTMSNETVRKYETIFEHPIDVDLWSGGVSERPLPGSMLGPTFACIIATQFSYSRRGDRFWFELPNQPSSFTSEQLAEIRKSRLARIICDNTDIIDTVQLYPMVLPDHELNPRVPCRSGIIPAMDFSKWAEPAPFRGPAKQFMTHAYILPKNETNCAESIDVVNIQINAAVNNESDQTINNQCGCNDTAGNIELLQKNTSNPEIDLTLLVQGCSEIVGDTTNFNNTQIKSDDNVNNDTVLKYVYKTDEKIIFPNKSTGHKKNSLKRRKRALTADVDNIRYAASAPLIVNYKTSHLPSHLPIITNTFARNTANVIRGSDLADFSIETLHKDIDPNKRKEGNTKTPNKDHYKTTRPIVQQVGEEREEYRDNNRKNKKSYSQSEENADKRGNSRGSNREHQSERAINEKEIQIKSPNDSEESNEREEYRKGNKNNKSYAEEDDSGEIKYQPKLYRDEEANEREDYRDDIKDNIPYLEKDESHEINGRPKLHQSEDSDEREKYREDEHDNKPYVDKEDHHEEKFQPKLSHDGESNEREEYRDNRKNIKPYVDEEYRDNRKNIKPYVDKEDSNKAIYKQKLHQNEKNNEKKEYYENRQNTKPYVEREDRQTNFRPKLHEDNDESYEQEQYRDDGRNNKAFVEKKDFQTKFRPRLYEHEESNEKEEYRDSRQNNESYRKREDSRDDIIRPKLYPDGEESNENEEYRDNRKNKKSHRESEESDEGNVYIETKESPQSRRDSHESDEKGDSQNNKYSTPPKESIDSREIESEETSYPKTINFKESKKNYDNFNKTDKKVLPRYENVIGEKHYQKDNRPPYQKESLYSQEYRENNHNKRDDTNLQLPIKKNNESEEEEEIIAIMKKKHRKPHNKPRSDYKYEPQDRPKASRAPIKIQDVDLGDFSYERIKVNNKGVVVPAGDAHENYDTDSLIGVEPLTTQKPERKLHDNAELYTRSREDTEISLDAPLSSEINEDSKQPTRINDEEIKPVVEVINNSRETSDEISKESIKSNLNNDDTSLETLLGVKIDTEEQTGTIITQPEKQEKGDVKQQFERIPLNYNHSKKKTQNKKLKVLTTESPVSSSEADYDDATHSEGTLDILAPEQHGYDENLKYKFDDITIKLPKIKLPKDILAYDYEEPSHKKDKQQIKPKFFQYSDENSEENRSEGKNKPDNEDYDYDNGHGYRGYYTDDKDKEDYYQKGKEKDDYKAEKKNQQDDEDEDDDLYEKFVRERFGKRDSFEKRSEQLRDARPIAENAQLFNTLQKVIKKTEDIHKEAEKSGDPKAGYMWTLEYGQNL